MSELKHFLVAMDGECSLCNRSIQFVAKNLKKEYKKHVSFCSLSSDAGKLLLEKSGLTPDALILFDGYDYIPGQAAALKLATMLGFPWSLMSGLGLFPNVIREWLYNKVAQHRHFFGMVEDSCRILDDLDVDIIETESDFFRLYL